MKNKLSITLLLFILMLTSCSSKNNNVIAIYPSELTESELRIVKLTGEEANGFYDYELNNSVNSIEIKTVCYIKNKEPVIVSNYSYNIERNELNKTYKGKLYLNINLNTNVIKTTNTVKTSKNSTNNYVFSENKISQNINFENSLAIGKYYRKDNVDIELNTEIPLLILKAYNKKVGQSGIITEEKTKVFNNTKLYSDDCNSIIVTTINFKSN